MKPRFALSISIIALIGLSLLLLVQTLPATLVVTPTTRLTSTAVSTLSAPTHPPVSTPTQPKVTPFAHPTCCSNGTPQIWVPSQGQVDLWTKVAATQNAIATQQGSIAQTPLPTDYYPEPSETSKTYTDPNYGYSFSYPANWYITPMDAVAVTNYSLDVDDKGFASNKEAVRIEVTKQKDLEPNQSFENYVRSLDWGGQTILAIGAGTTLPGGLQTFQVKIRSEPYEFWVNYITDGLRVFSVYVRVDKTYTFVQKRIVESFTFPDDFPAPGAAWLEYHDPNGEYNFKYPANWYLTQMDTVALTNHSLVGGSFIKDMVFKPDYMRFDVTKQRNLESNESFADYVKSMNWGGQKVLSIGTETVLPSGLRTYHVRVETGHSAGGDVFFDYITDGTKVFALIGWADRPYSYVQEKAVESFTFPNDYPAPTEKWLKYHDKHFGIGFEYPVNWFVTFTEREVAISNYSLGIYRKGFDTEPKATRINITPERDLNPNESLDAYVASTIDSSELIFKEPIVTLGTDLQVSTLTILDKNRLWTVGVTYITNGVKVFKFIVIINDGKDKPNASLLDRLIKTVSIP